MSREKSYLKASRACSHEKVGLAAEDGLVDMEGQILAFDDQVGELLGGKEAGESSYLRICTRKVKSKAAGKEVGVLLYL